MAYTGYAITTISNQQDLSQFAIVNGFQVAATVPTGCDIRYLVKTNAWDSWKYWDITNHAWADAATQSLTAESILQEGNTQAELEAVSQMQDFIGASAVNFAVAFSAPDTAIGESDTPVLRSITIIGRSGGRLVEESIYSQIYSLTDSDEAFPIVDIRVEKTEVGTGTVTLYASILNEDDEWSEYADYRTYLTFPNTMAKAIKFKATFKTPDIANDSATLNNVVLVHRLDKLSIVTDGTAVCVTKTYHFSEPIAQAHLMVKHKEVQDTTFTAYISLRNPPTHVTGETLAVGDGTQQQVRLEHTENLNSQNFVLKYDGVPVGSGYAYSASTGLVTFTAPVGTVVTADYEYNWSPEVFTPMRADTRYADMENSDIISQQFDYLATSPSAPQGEVATVKVVMTQETGSVTGEALGIGTGNAGAYELAHNPVPDTIVVTPNTATWYWLASADKLVVNAPAGQAVSVSYDWKAKTNYIDALACVFNE